MVKKTDKMRIMGDKRYIKKKRMINKMKNEMTGNRTLTRDKDGKNIDKMRIMGDKRYIKMKRMINKMKIEMTENRALTRDKDGRKNRQNENNGG
jgi:hypothetical protein